MSRQSMKKRFCSMHSRCYDKSNIKYHRYGGRGITVCERWHTFDNYYLDIGDLPKGSTLDRIDNDGPYSPENCRVASYSQQARNRSDTHIVFFNGLSLSLTEWAERIGLRRETLRNRILRGWSVYDALTTTKQKNGKARALLQSAPQSSNEPVAHHPV